MGSEPRRAIDESDESRLVFDFDDGLTAKGYHRAGDRIRITEYTVTDDAIEDRSTWAIIRGVTGDHLIVDRWATIGPDTDGAVGEGHIIPLRDDGRVGDDGDVAQGLPPRRAEAFIADDFADVRADIFDAADPDDPGSTDDFERVISEYGQRGGTRIALPVVNL